MSDIQKELKRHLPLEFAAHLRYGGHAVMLKIRGYAKLAEKYEAESAEEKGHADKIMFRMHEMGLYPDYSAPEKVAPVKDWNIETMLDSDLVLETKVLESLTTVADCAEHESDYATSELVRELIVETQEHVTWLRSQCGQVRELGVQNYLQAQI